MVQTFLDVFSEKLQGLTLEREDEFNIKLALGITHISKVPYRIALVEL